MTTDSKTIIFHDDTVELIRNNIISNRPYLFRISGWNNYYDFRASKQDLLNLVESIIAFVNTNEEE